MAYQITREKDGRREERQWEGGTVVEKVRNIKYILKLIIIIIIVIIIIIIIILLEITI